MATAISEIPVLKDQSAIDFLNETVIQRIGLMRLHFYIWVICTMKMLSRHHKETSSAYRRRKSTANHRRNTATNRCAVLHKVRPYSEISGGQYRRLAADVGAINSSTRQLVYSSSYKSYQFTGNKLTFSRLLTFESSPHTLLPLSKAIRGRDGGRVAFCYHARKK